jgi:hypothetical protein
MDDLFIAGDSKTNISTLKNTLSNYFKILDLGVYYFYLGIEIIYNHPCRIFRLS